MAQLPLINQAVAGLAQKDYPAGISLNNMIRQIGGAFGIALANNYVTHQYAQHRADLVANVYSGSAALGERVDNLSHALASRTGNVADATTQAYQLINASVEKQSYYLAYLDTFHLIGIFFIVVLPLLFFMKSKK